MKVLFVMNGVSYGFSGKPNVSGGDVMSIEIAKKWVQKGVVVHFLTSLAGKELCERLGLEAIYHLSHSSNNSSASGSISSAVKSTKSVSSVMKKENFDVVFSTCEHLYDVLPAFRMKRKNVKWAAVVHFVPPPPWKRIKAGRIKALLYYMNHMSGAYVIRNNADLVFAVSQRTANDYVSHLKLDVRKVVTIPAGVNFNAIRSIATSSHEKEYDAIFMKRLQAMKGVFDVIEVWRYIITVCPDAQLLIVGEGSIDVVNRLKDIIRKTGLTKNVKLIGPVYDENEKILLLAKSKLFLLPSYEENWAIVIGEALTAGLPVVAYDLPEIRPVWRDNVVWVPKGNVELFAKQVSELLKDEEYYKTYLNKAINFMKRFDWKTIAETEFRLCSILTSPGGRGKLKPDDKSNHNSSIDTSIFTLG
jgi:glycosyltransferase involved in cell wall biosynthesis